MSSWTFLSLASQLSNKKTPSTSLSILHQLHTLKSHSNSDLTRLYHNPKIAEWSHLRLILILTSNKLLFALIKRASSWHSRVHYCWLHLVLVYMDCVTKSYAGFGYAIVAYATYSMLAWAWNANRLRSFAPPSYNLVIELETRTDLERKRFADDEISLRAVADGRGDDEFEFAVRFVMTMGWQISVIGRMPLALLDEVKERHLAMSRFRSFRCPAKPAAAKGNGTKRWSTWNLCSSRYFFEQKHR